MKWYPSLFLMFSHWLHGLYTYITQDATVQRCATQSILFKGVLHSLFCSKVCYTVYSWCACCVYLFQCRFWDIILSCLTQYIHSLTPEQLLHTNTWLWLFIVAIIYCKCYNHVPRSFQIECVQIIRSTVDGPGNRLYETHYDLLLAWEWHKGIYVVPMLQTRGCVNFTYSGSHTMHICHNISTVHWLEWPPPKVVYQPNCECGGPFMTKEMLCGIGLPLDVPLPHALWMMPHRWVCCVMACCLVLQSHHPVQRMLWMHNIRLQGSYICILHHIIKCKLLWQSNVI